MKPRQDEDGVGDQQAQGRRAPRIDRRVELRLQLALELAR
jgi:hypothetical protein